ncbi:hypothetical protein AKJ16_DCAP12803 [Drosera capensis]
MGYGSRVTEATPIMATTNTRGSLYPQPMATTNTRGSLYSQPMHLNLGQVHHQDHIESGVTRGQNHLPFRRASSSSKPLFNWADHPDLVTDAVETGWSRFAFMINHKMHPSVVRSPSLLGFRDHGRETLQQAEMSWEIGEGSVDFMQKVRLNPGEIHNIKKTMMIGARDNTLGARTIVRTALPLPGPAPSFPQEAYFEIIVLDVIEEGRQKMKGDGEKTKLIGLNLESLSHVSSVHSIQGFEEVKKTGAREAVRVSVGFGTAGSLPFRVPGSYAGSIGFNSNGSVFLDGKELVYESEKEDWGQAEKVIGCGFDPRKKKVFFTVDSEIVHVILCKSEEFGAPLYPVLAADIDLTVLVNFGQTSFSYAPVNSNRTSNPCFIGPHGNDPVAAQLADVDSRELFSMGRVDSGWLNHGTTRSGTPSIVINNDKFHEIDQESESDLFEIVLDVTDKSDKIHR